MDLVCRRQDCYSVHHAIKLPDQFWLHGWLLAGVACAHEPFESTATARLQHGRLEVVLTLSTGMAAALVKTGDVESEPTAAFDSYRARLEALAPGLLKVAAGGQALVAQRIVVRRNPSAEPEIVYLYPAPPPGALRFDAAYLRELPPSYFGQLAVLNDDEKQIGTSLLVAEKPVAEVAMPAPAADVAAASPPTRAVFSQLIWWSVGAGVAGLSVLWLRRRRRL